MANIRYALLSTLKMMRINTGNARLAKMELKDTNLVRNNTIKKTPTQPKAVQGEIAIINPNKVATPLPPLNSAQMGKICPKTAANPNPI